MKNTCPFKKTRCNTYLKYNPNLIRFWAAATREFQAVSKNLLLILSQQKN